MTTLRQVAVALAARIDTIPELEVHEFVPPTVAHFPIAFVTPPTFEYEGLSLTSIEATFGVVVLASRNVDRKQLDLYDYVDLTGPRSIPAVVNGDTTLGLSGVHAFTLAARPLGAEEIAGYNAFGVVIDVMVRLS